MTDHEFDELMRDLDPARAADVPPPDSVRHRSIRDRALGEPSPRRSRRVLVAVAAALVVTGAAAGAMVLWSDEPDVFAVSCYAEADLGSDRVQGDPTLGVGPEACAPLWQSGGAFGDGPPPPLAACIVDGAVGVFPGPEGTCGDLGLARSVGGETALATMVELDAALRGAIVQTPCVSPEDAVPAAERIVADLALDRAGWTVRQTTETTAERPCASYSVDEERKLIAIVPIP
ncbi:MAG: hypothetical protein AAF480_00690 [Actinomycetota bacterium]